VKSGQKLSQKPEAVNRRAGRQRGGGDRKVHYHLVLNERLLVALRAKASARRLPTVAIVTAALEAYLSESGQDERDAQLAKPLNRLSRAIESLAWDTKLLVAMSAYQVEFALAYGPEAITPEEQEAIDIKRTRRFDRFEQWLAQSVVDPENLHGRLLATISTAEQDFIAEPPG
jgi:hypothetical protein